MDSVRICARVCASTPCEERFEALMMTPATTTMTQETEELPSSAAGKLHAAPVASGRRRTRRCPHHRQTASLAVSHLPSHRPTRSYVPRTTRAAEWWARPAVNYAFAGLGGTSWTRLCPPLGLQKQPVATPPCPPSETASSAPGPQTRPQLHSVATMETSCRAQPSCTLCQEHPERDRQHVDPQGSAKGPRSTGSLVTASTCQGVKSSNDENPQCVGRQTL